MFPDLESELEQYMPAFVRADAAGETLRVYTDVYLGRDPDEGSHQWDDDPDPVTVDGRIEQTSDPREMVDTDGSMIRSQHDVFVPAGTDITDGRDGGESRASVVEDSRGVRYRIIKITDEHNGLYRCAATLE